MIYLTLSMRFAVRALSVFLIGWLTASAAFSPCCWSMTYGQAHHAPQADASTPHEHHHHDNRDLGAPASAMAIASAGAEGDCDVEPVDAIGAAGTTHLRAGLRAAVAVATALAAPQVITLIVQRPDLGPPGPSSSSAFLSPLRI